jgi:lipid-binding SYLF domain-containing protein
MTRSSFLRAALTALAVALPMAFLLTTPLAADEKSRLTEEVQEATAALVKRDESLAGEIAKAAGYAVFPGVGKGGLGLGAAYGSGQVVVNGTPVARVKLTQVTIGFQLGGQKYVEMILFENQKTLDRFLEGKFTFAAQASAVAVSSGASANAKYSNGVKVITMTIGGLMYEASLGGQKFSVDKY